MPLSSIAEAQAAELRVPTEPTNPPEAPPSQATTATAKASADPKPQKPALKPQPGASVGAGQAAVADAEQPSRSILLGTECQQFPAMA